MVGGFLTLLLMAAAPAAEVSLPKVSPPAADISQPHAAELQPRAVGEGERAAPPDTAVVCPAAFREALAPWLEHRRRQGHSIALISNLGSPDTIRRQIRQLADRGSLRFVVLVGDADPQLYRDDGLRAVCVPTHYAKARVNVLWKSEPTIATDNWYAQPEDASDERPRPDLAVGRITADSPKELRQIVAKILAYERSSDFGPWRRQLNFVAGVGGFGALADAVLESAAYYFLTHGIPADYHLTMTYGSWRSPYCPDPRFFRETTLRRLNEGALFWVYIGHGHPLGVDRVCVPGGPYRILDNPDTAWLDCRRGRPIALFMACYTGAIDARQDCLAEAMLRAPGGPVAVLAGSRVTMPYAMTVLATNLGDEIFHKHTLTLGEAVLHAKQALLCEPREGDRQRATLDAIARVISPSGKQLAAERAEHVLLYNLIGDPLLRLPRPKPIQLEVPAKVVAGQSLEVAGRCSMDGQGTLELAVERDRLTFPRPERGEYPRTASGLSGFQQVYERANDRRLAGVAVDVRGGRFVARLAVPEGAAGACHVIMYVQGEEGFASGAADVLVESNGQAAAPGRSRR